MGIPQRLSAAIALYLLFVSGSQLTNTKAMVLASADTATNKSGPTSGLPLDHVGVVNHGESGVYLGNYHGKSWVLTANHSGPGSFELGGITYPAVAGSTRQLSNPDSTPSDIVLFQIAGDPGLSQLNLAPGTGKSRPGIHDWIWPVGAAKSKLLD